jgi:hypothetical protein
MDSNSKIDNLFLGMDLNQEQREKLEQTARDVASMGYAGTNDILTALSDLVNPYRYVFSIWTSLVNYRTRAEIRREKKDRRQARHYFMTHGKHGLKRPKGRRNA